MLLQSFSFLIHGAANFPITKLSNTFELRLKEHICVVGGRKKGKFPVKGAIEVSSPGAGTELDADLTLNRKTPSADIPRGV